MMKSNALFSSYSIGNKVFKNRLIMLPTVTNYANTDGSISQKNLDYYSLRKNISAIITEAAYTHSLGKSFTHQIGIDSDDKIEGLSRLSQVIHNNKSYAGIQLAMNVKSKTINELTLSEIEDIKDSFIKAAMRSRNANFDIVEVHCAHGWLLGQFLSNYFNHRNDSFGGHLQNRMKLPLEIIKAIRDTVKDQLLSVRINAVDYIENGIEIDEAIVFSHRLKEIGVDLISISAGIGAKTFIHVSPSSYPNGFLLDYAQKIKINTDLPIIAANRLNDFDLASTAVEQSKTDFIGLARSLIADPNIVTKWQNGRFEEVVPCIGCNQACIANIQSQKPMSCLMNPLPYQAHTLNQPFMYKRKIMIIGAGPAGLALAVFAHQRGLNCVIFEKQTKIGGQINLAIKPPHKQEFKKMLNYFEYKIEELKIPLFTNVEANIELIKSEKPDVVAFALGSIPYIPDFALNNEFVLTADEVLEFGIPFDARHICVIGGGLVGLETANLLANKGLRVSVFELQDSLLKNTPDVLKIPILESLHSNIKIFLNHKLINIKDSTVYFQTQNGFSEHSFDYLVLALGRKPNRDLINQVNFCIDTIDIGDCKNPQDAQAAINDAYNAAQML